MVDLNKELEVHDIKTGFTSPADVVYDDGYWIVVRISKNPKCITFWKTQFADELHVRTSTTPERYRGLVLRNKKPDEKWCVAYKDGAYGIGNDFTISPRTSLDRIKEDADKMGYKDDVIGYYEMVSKRFVAKDLF